jgi:hypothetical protein
LAKAQSFFDQGKAKLQQQKAYPQSKKKVPTTAAKAPKTLPGGTNIASVIQKAGAIRSLKRKPDVGDESKEEDQDVSSSSTLQAKRRITKKGTPYLSSMAHVNLTRKNWFTFC